MSEKIPTDPVERFFYWIKERYQIHHLRAQGCPKPWTEDKILQTVFFTNPYREMDKTTTWFRENVRDPLRDKQEVLFTCLAFRLFNYIPTGCVLEGLNPQAVYRDPDDPTGLVSLERTAESLFEQWNEDEALKRLWAQDERHGKTFTGAYIVKLFNGMKKIDAACDILDIMWKDRESLYVDLMGDHGQHKHPGGPHSLQYATERIMRYPQMGAFMAYEVVCDLRYTHILEHAPDKLTWANIGPGCNRGLFRLFDPTVNFARHKTPKFPNPLGRMQWLLAEAPKYLGDALKKSWTIPKGTVAAWGPFVGKIPKMPRLEMREIEHSLCEFDKYERARVGDHALKRHFQGVR